MVPPTYAMAYATLAYPTGKRNKNWCQMSLPAFSIKLTPMPLVMNGHRYCYQYSCSIIRGLFPPCSSFRISPWTVVASSEPISHTLIRVFWRQEARLYTFTLIPSFSARYPEGHITVFWRNSPILPPPFFETVTHVVDHVSLSLTCHHHYCWQGRWECCSSVEQVSESLISDTQTLM